MISYIRTLAIIAFVATASANAQEVSPKFEQQGELIKGTYYYEDGTIRQEGTYKDGQLHGKWISYQQNGKKNAIAHYENGVKAGKWFFWSNDLLTEVDYNNNYIVQAVSYKDTRSLVINP